jgi:hypothetical protein
MVFIGQVIPETICRNQDHIGLFFLSSTIYPIRYNLLCGILGNYCTQAYKREKKDKKGFVFHDTKFYMES